MNTMHLPTIHTNGTSAAELTDAYSDAFLAVRFIESIQKFSVVGWREPNGVLAVPGKNRDHTSFRQGKPFDNDFAVNYGASS